MAGGAGALHDRRAKQSFSPFTPVIAIGFSSNSRALRAIEARRQRHVGRRGIDVALPGVVQRHRADRIEALRTEGARLSEREACGIACSG